MNSINNTESAIQIGYDNSESGLSATDVQGAVDEVASGLGQIRTSEDSIYWGTYPNGQAAGAARVIVPIWNPDGKTAKVSEAYIYDSSGNFTDIKSAVAVRQTMMSYAIVTCAFNSTYASKLLRINLYLADA